MTGTAGAPARRSSGTSPDAEHWEELQLLFERFERTPSAEREQALAAACADPALRRRVLDLLNAADEMESAGQPASVGPRTHGSLSDGSLSNGSASVQPPATRGAAYIGAYRLVRKIGAGGLGAVYLAERLIDGVTLRSALKILAPHAVDASFVERFYREQQSLAALDHPNITRLLDAGWNEAGQPYLVMEYVEGAHLDEYCDARNLEVEARLRLFLQICDAVSNAHRNLIVHLDLKPSNILVSTSDTVKLLDFGTSKLLRLDGDSTSTIMATPAYASPEQLLNEPVSTASDVYGLGAILFELLAGRAPFGKISAAARIEATARQADPDSITKCVTPDAAARRGLSEARLRQVLRGDLAAIVAACLRSRPQDRYTSVDALSDDIKRYLDCKPVRARRQTLTYTAGKFLRRHRLSAAAAGAIVLTVAVSAAYAWSQQRAALREAERSVRMQTFLFSLFKMANPNYTGKPVATVPEFLRVGMAKLPDFIHDPADLREAQLGLAESMYESGDYVNARAAFARTIASAAAMHATADQAEAEAYAGAIEFQQSHVAAGRALEAHALTLARSARVPPRVRVLAEVFFATNEDNSGFRRDQNLALLRAAVQESRDRRLATPVTALALHGLASDLDLRGDEPEAKAIFEELLALYGQDPLALCDRSETYAWLAWIDDKSGDAAGSVPLYERAYQGFAACAGPDSRGALDQLPYWADALIKTGRAAQAVSMLEQALPTWRRVEGNDPSASGMLYFLARGDVALGRFADAERYARELLALLTSTQAPEDRGIGMAHLVLGQALAGQHRNAEALPHARAANALLAVNVQSAYGKSVLAESAALLAQVQPTQIQ